MKPKKEIKKTTHKQQIQKIEYHFTKYMESIIIMRIMFKLAGVKPLYATQKELKEKNNRIEFRYQNQNNNIRAMFEISRCCIYNYSIQL